MDAINYNQQMSGMNKPTSTPINQAKEETSCFDVDNSWCNNAADAIGQAFSNMDDFLASYKESRVQPD